MKPKKSTRWPARFVENFFDSWNPNMAYILGYFAADGTMYKNKRGSCYIAFTSTDKELLMLIKNIMQASNRIEIYKRKGKNWKTRFTIQIGCKKIFGKLLQLGFTPNKNLTLRFPEIPDQYLGHFFRGYFDGDGCASFGFYKRKDRKSLRRVLNLRIRCGSNDFIRGLQKQVSAVISAVKGCLYFHSKAYTLVYNSADVIKLYNLMYPSLNVPCLTRKRDILIKGIKSVVGS